MKPGQDKVKIDVEFSLALHEKTGKYFIGRDICESNADLIHTGLYWRVASASVPLGVAARVIGRFLVLEADARIASPTFDRLAPRMRRPRPVLHMDPFTTLIHGVGSRDIVLCHDVGPLTHPDLFGPGVARAYEKAYRDIAAVGPFMVFVSRGSQAAFHELHPGPFAGSRVIYPALRAELVGGARTPPAAVGSRFLLTVGSMGARKNQSRAIEAFGRSGLAAGGVQYVLCGAREPGYEAVAAAAARTEGVVLLGYVDDATLNWLYAHACGFVLPSRLEGFGIPVAEAIFRGLIPLVSADSVMQEVAGEGALVVDPTDPDDISAAMRRLVAITRPEAETRRILLARSVARFSPEAFNREWRGAIETAIAAWATPGRPERN